MTAKPAAGWWCERCGHTPRLADELEAPQRCSICRKPTVIWIPPAPPPAPRLTVERATTLFSEIYELVDSL